MTKLAMTAVTMMAQSQFECLRIDPIIKCFESAEPQNVMAVGKPGQTVKQAVFTPRAVFDPTVPAPKVPSRSVWRSSGSGSMGLHPALNLIRSPGRREALGPIDNKGGVVSHPAPKPDPKWIRMNNGL
jgi:hypothetical protein